MIDWIEIIGSESCQTPVPPAAVKKLSQSSSTSMSSLGIFIRIFYQLFLSQTGFFFLQLNLFRHHRRPIRLLLYPLLLDELHLYDVRVRDNRIQVLVSSFFCHGNFAHNEIQFCRHIDARESQYIANSVAVFKRSFSKQSHQFCRL